MALRLSLAALLLLLGTSLTEARPRGRILGGAQTEPNLRPYMASIQVNETHECGGLLITPQWVLSAAHCLPESNYSTLRILLGAHSLTEPEPHKQYFQIQKQVAHPNYTTSNNHNDILLLQLNETATLGPAVNVFPYEREDTDVQPDTMCRVAGWGMISLTGRRPDKLNEVQVPVIARETCNRRDQYANELTKNMLCAGARRKDSCEGDSGGPLICGEKAVGIVSYGNRKCGNSKKPGIYTRISAYTSWIDAVLEESKKEEESALVAAESPAKEAPGSV
ncbi:complement factor D-like [Ambystoma mexicanum]|uniref:complement factor D-like n=1 Tax=Ambystoma mexicanum TaxID=8296 RepID=UPI0037E7E880